MASNNFFITIIILICTWGNIITSSTIFPSFVESMKASYAYPESYAEKDISWNLLKNNYEKK